MAYNWREVYVDASIGTDTGSGTLASPWGRATTSVVQYALDQTPVGTDTDGVRINVKSGSADVLTAALNLTTHGTPTDAAPCIIQGYDSVAGDGGIGEIDGNNANVLIMDESSAGDHMAWIDMKVGNTGTAKVLRLDADCIFWNCEIHTSSSALPLHIGTGSSVYNCYFHGFTSTAANNSIIYPSTNPVVTGCYIDGTGGNWDRGVIYGTSGSSITNNIIIVDDADCEGIRCTNTGVYIANNSIRQTAASPSSARGGIKWHTATVTAGLVCNNIIEGFYYAFLGPTGGEWSGIVSNNYFYDCTAADSWPNDPPIFFDTGLTELDAAPWVDAANGDFRVTSALREKGFPQTFPGLPLSKNYIDAGACQRKEPLITALQNARLG